MTNAKEITILYRNHRREIALRRIVPLSMWFGESYWHPGGERWFLKAFDCEKKAERDFEFASIVSTG